MSQPGPAQPRRSEPQLVAAAVWRTTAGLITALDDRFGEPIDAYVNGSQVWLRDDGPGGVTLEWRLHPVAGYQRPPGIGTEEVFSTVSLAIASAEAPPASPESLWDGLEVFAAYDDDDPLAPDALAEAATAALGIAPDAAGAVDHEPINERWTSTGGKVSIVDDLLRQLGAAAPAPED